MVSTAGDHLLSDHLHPEKSQPLRRARTHSSVPFRTARLMPSCFFFSFWPCSERDLGPLRKKSQHLDTGHSRKPPTPPRSSSPVTEALSRPRLASLPPSPPSAPLRCPRSPVTTFQLPPRHPVLSPGREAALSWTED